MWNYNNDDKKWYQTTDTITNYDFELLENDSERVSFYSRCFSGSVYLPINTTENIYDILQYKKNINWYIDNSTFKYNILDMPTSYNMPITQSNIDYYYNKYITEYGYTLKTLFTPQRLIADSMTNYKYVDVASTEPINLNDISIGSIIDNVALIEGQRVLIKDNTNNVTLLSDVDPNDYFNCDYELYKDNGGSKTYTYYTDENGIYVFTNGKLIRDVDLDDYKRCIRYSVYIKMGETNIGKQYHLCRLKDGSFPKNGDKQSIKFADGHNWIIRNKVDYNNLYEINYYDILEHDNSKYCIDNITYSIPHRILTVGEFGIILVTQEKISITSDIKEYTSNIIYNKYKVDLKSITENKYYYWICGADSTLLRVQKHDFAIKKIKIENIATYLPHPIKSTLKSISFYDNKNGVVVGELNTIFYTDDGGYNWKRIEFKEFNDFNYNKVIFYDDTTIYICGDNGIMIRLTKSNNIWYAFKKKISQNEYSDSEFKLMENINDMIIIDIDNYSFIKHTLNDDYTDNTTTKITLNGKYMLLVCDKNKLIIYDFLTDISTINTSTSAIDNLFFLNINNTDYNDIKTVSFKNNIIYFNGYDDVTDTDNVYKISLTNFNYCGKYDNIEKEIQYTNTLFSTINAISIYDEYVNKIYGYGNNIYLCGNDSLLKKSNYDNNFTNVSDIDSKLSSKMLILDYDIANKVNFFDDTHTYRMPISATISTSNKLSDISFSNIDDEYNWINYYVDSLKTFRYGVAYDDNHKPMDDSSCVYMSCKFIKSNTSNKITYTNTSISDNNIEINELLPYNSHYHTNITKSINTSLSTDKSIFIKDGMIVFKTTQTLFNVGDVILFDSDIVKCKMIINRKENVYAYAQCTFNDSIINSLKKSTNNFTLTDLNYYNTISDLINNFNNHYLSNCYILSYDNNILTISTKFNNKTAYYNLQTLITYNNNQKIKMLYKESFMKFGYSPKYNILDYLKSISDVFTDDKEFLVMPKYKNIPLSKSAKNNKTTISYDYDGMIVNGYNDSDVLTNDNIVCSNILYFGSELKKEWESIFINTFIDIIITDGSIYTSNDMLVVDKYYNADDDIYVIEFNKALNYKKRSVGNTIDILSHNTLKQISDDLNEFNNIQPNKNKITNLTWFGASISTTITKDATSTITSFGSVLKNMIPTDSYAKILLSDGDILEKLSTIIYIDYKNELSMNVINIDNNKKIDILNVSKFTTSNGVDYPLITCRYKHNLKDDDYVILSFNGGKESSEYKNQHYFGYQIVKKINEIQFIINVPYGIDVLSGNDIGIAIHQKSDSFLNFEPIDLIDLGIDGNGKIALELNTDNTLYDGEVYKLSDVDYKKYRFRLVDTLNIKTLSLNYSWFLEAEVSNAIIGFKDGMFAWYGGTWIFGRWYGGVWYSGVWLYGAWYGGIWNSYKIEDKILYIDINEEYNDDKQSFWYNGMWYSGTWNNGIWNNGRWYDGIWNNGLWRSGIWNNGTWNDGNFNGGVWVEGTWNKGIFNSDINPSYWLDGIWNGGDFENGLWYNGTFTEKIIHSRFGTKAHNTRNAIWESGNFLKGSFYSNLELDENNTDEICKTHNYSIWKTGNFIGEWHGGIAYNINFKSSIWYGGIVDEVQILNVDVINKNELRFTLNGYFRYNIGDTFYVVDDDSESYDGTTSLGTILHPLKYTIIDYKNTTLENYIDENKTNIQKRLKITYLYVSNPNNIENLYHKYNTTIDGTYKKLRLVSSFHNSEWKSGIFTNGVFENGLMNSVIWYNGTFDGIWG